MSIGVLLRWVAFTALIVALTERQSAAQPLAASPASTPAAAESHHEALAGFWREDRKGPPGAPPTGRAPIPSGPATLVRQAAMGHLQPWVQRRFDAFNAARAKGIELRTRGISCLPWAVAGTGVPGGSSYAMDLLVTPAQVIFLYELDHQSNIVFMNQNHPKSLQPSTFGNSVGHWEGDTLVIDTIGFDDNTDIYYGIAHTRALHVVERLSLVGGYLHARVTYEDPKAFTSPFSYEQDFQRAKPFQEYVCAQNNMDGNGPPPPAAVPPADH